MNNLQAEQNKYLLDYIKYSLKLPEQAMYQATMVLIKQHLFNNIYSDI